MMALLCDGNINWSNHPIISKESRDWLHLEDEVFQSETPCFDTSFIKKMAADKQWLSLNKCIDDACPVHAEAKFPESLTSLSVEDQQKHISTDVDNIVHISDDVERTKCRRQLFGGDVPYNEFATGTEFYTEPKVPFSHDFDKSSNTLEQTNALQNIVRCDNETIPTVSHSQSKIAKYQELTETGLKDQLTDVVNKIEKSYSSRPRFLCTWLQENVSIEKYPLYKLSLSSATSVPPGRENVRVFSEATTDTIWKPHCYIGELDCEITSDKTLNSSCKKSKSLENCAKETPASVIKEIIDVDISDLKSKYSFLFHQPYIFQTKNVTKHPTVNQYAPAQYNMISPQYGIGVNKHVNKKFNQGYHNTAEMTTPKYISVNSTKLNPFVSATNSPQLLGNCTYSPLIGYQKMKYPTGTLVNFSKSLRDPRLNRVKAETLSSGDRSLTNSPCVNYESEPNYVYDISDYLYNIAYNSSVEGTPTYIVETSSPIQGINDSMTYEHLKPALSVCTDRMSSPNMNFIGSPAVSGLSKSSESPLVGYSINDPDNGSPLGRRFYFQPNWCQSPVSDNSYASRKNFPYTHQRDQRDSDERLRNRRRSPDRKTRRHDNEHVSSRSRSRHYSSGDRHSYHRQHETREIPYSEGYYIDNRKESLRGSPDGNTSIYHTSDHSDKFDKSRDRFTKATKDECDDRMLNHRSTRNGSDDFMPSSRDRDRSRVSTNQRGSNLTRDRMHDSLSGSHYETRRGRISVTSVRNEECVRVELSGRESRQYSNDRNRRSDRGHSKEHNSFSNEARSSFENRSRSSSRYESKSRSNSRNESRSNSQNVASSKSNSKSAARSKSNSQSVARSESSSQSVGRSRSNSKYHCRSYRRSRSRSCSRISRKSRV